MSLTRLSNKQLLTSAIWNAVMAEIEARLDAIGGSSISWPLSGGNIDMDRQYEIVGLRSLWNIINAGEYDNLEAAVSAADTAGGTCVFIPPDKEVECTSATITTSGTIIMGAGPTSVIKMLASDGPIITTGTGGLTDIGIYNLTINMAGGNAGAQGVVAKRITRFQADNVYFSGGKGVHLKLTNGGTPGQSCTNVRLSNLHFNGGTGTGAHHIFADDLDGLVASNIYSSACASTTAAIYMAQAASAKLRDITMVNVQVDSPTAKGISIVSNSGTVSDDCSRITLSTVHVDTPTSTGIELGASSKKVKHGRLVNCHVISAGGITGIALNATYGMVLGCSAPAHAPGLDLVDSTDVFVNGGLYKDCTTYGIDADGTTDCTIEANDVRDCTTAGIKKSSSTGLECIANPGDVGKLSSFIDYPNKQPGAGVDGNVWTYTIKGGTLSKIGDSIIVSVAVDCSGTADDVNVYVKVGSTISVSTTWGDSTNDCVGTARIAMILGPTTASNTIGWGIGTNENNGTRATYVAPATIDWSVDQTLAVDFQQAAGQDATLKYVSVQILEGTEQGAAT